MTSSSTFLRVSSIALAVLLGRGAGAADAQPAAKETGDLWEVTTQMSMEGMEGMSMPQQTNRVCSDRQWNKPPVNTSEQGCQTLDFKNTPTKSTWKVRCDGPPAMTGEGEIVRSGNDGYTGWMKMTSSEGVLTMKLSGKKVGECDVAAAKQERAQTIAKAQTQAAAAERSAAETKAQVCKAPVEALDFRQLDAQAAFCDDPALKASLCGRVDTLDGFTRLCARRPESGNGLKETAAYCAADADAIQKKYCDEALAKETLDLLGRCCPAQAQGLAQRECAGRKYTAMTGSKYQSFCVTYAQNMEAGGKDDPNAAKPESTREKTKKTLKSLFPH
jgi:hypothetical protein